MDDDCEACHQPTGADRIELVELFDVAPGVTIEGMTVDAHTACAVEMRASGYYRPATAG